MWSFNVESTRLVLLVKVSPSLLMFLYSVFIDNWFNQSGFVAEPRGRVTADPVRPLWSEHVLLTSAKTQRRLSVA